MLLNDGSSGALALASAWHEPALTSLLTDWRETKRLLHIDGTKTTERIPASQASAPEE